MSREPRDQERLASERDNETEAEHSMTSGADQRIVEERERQRDAISNAKPRQDEPDTVADPAGLERDETARRDRRG